MKRMLNEATRVKNAKLFFDSETNVYSLIHYDTEIFSCYQDPYTHELRLFEAKKCSNSSSNAIRQVCEFLKIDYYETIKPIMKPTKFHKYKTGELDKRNNNDWLNIIEQ